MNRQYMKPRVIRASAGTGKTYQLALEFIGILIRYKEDISFEQIVVITFTRKATSEIRQRIIEFLYKLAVEPETNKDLIANLNKIYSDIDFSKDTSEYLFLVYKQIVTNKSRLNVSTLDGFINQIFKSLIAPFYNIAEYDIDPLYNENILPKLYDLLLKDEYYHLLDEIFKTTHSRNISAYDGFINKLLEYRWIFEFYFAAQRSNINQIQEGEKTLKLLSLAAEAFCSKFADIVKNSYPDKNADEIFPKAWFELLIEDKKLLSPLALINALLEKLQNDEFLLNNTNLIDNPNNFWNGSKLLRGKKNEINKTDLTALQNEVKTLWKRFVFFSLAIPEQDAIIKIARLIYDKYDLIKFREKVFTYSDIAFYTWKYFRNPENSVIDKHQVINLFYEQLSYRIRFILIDEFQDTSIIQWNIFAPLINELIAGIGINDTGSSVIVGDEKQAIYAWRSGERDLLVNLENILNHEFDSRILDTSYRSSKSVVQFVNRLFMNDFFHNITDTIKANWNYDKVKVMKNTEGYCYFKLNNMNRGDSKITFPQAVEEFFLDQGFFSETNQNISLKDTAILTRSRSEIDDICSVLRKHGISYIDEAGSSIINHRAIRPLFNLLKWFTNLDLYSLVLFLRSDLVLIPSANLKQILEIFHLSKRNDSPFYLQMYDKCSHIPAIKIVAELHPLRSKLLKLLKHAAKAFNLTKIFNQESDLVNIQKFFDIVADFSAGKSDYTNNSAGLLLYLSDNEFAEEFAQAEIVKQNALKIMTIHKSKGLEFDSVFLILNGSKHKPHNFNLSIYPQFDSSYANLEECFFTWNYDKYLTATKYAPLANAKKIKDYVEDINLWYVALTRAKRNLFGLYAYSFNKADPLKYFNNINGSNNDLNINKLMIFSMLNEFSGQTESNEFHTNISFGEIEPYQKISLQAESSAKKAIDISSWYNSLSKDSLVEKEDWELCLNQNAMMTQAEAKFMGNLAHYYLQQIEFDSPAQRIYALNKSIEFYGNLIPASLIKDTCKTLNDFLDKYSEFFDSKNWDAVFREYVVFRKKSEFRIDRLLVSHKRKEIMILDYKTGKITDPKQLANYKNIIEQIPFVKNNNYTVLTGKFLKINLQS